MRETGLSLMVYGIWERTYYTHPKQSWGGGMYESPGLSVHPSILLAEVLLAQFLLNRSRDFDVIL